MELLDILICIVALTAIVSQAFLTEKRHFIMTSGASIGLFLVWLKTGSIESTLHLIPLDVMLILLGLTLYGDYILKSNVFALIIKWIAKICKGNKIRIYIVFSVLVFVISSLLNNYQAVLLLTPALIGILSQLEGVQKYYISILFGTVIILSNLGGAALPISDFPALYMFIKGIISFESYVPTATPMVVLATTLVILFGAMIIKIKSKSNEPKESLVSVAFTTALYRGVKVEKTKLIWAGITFVGMMIFWIKGVDPTVVTLIGLTSLAIVIEKGQFLERRIGKLETPIFIFYLSLFAIIATIQSTPLLDIIANWLLSYKESPLTMILFFTATTTLVTSIVSAGPSTIALLPVALDIQDSFPDNMAVTCFALSICAGSSIFTFSATAGPLVQTLTEKYKLKVDGKEVSFGTKQYFLPGIIGGVIIFAVNLFYIFTNI